MKEYESLIFNSLEQLGAEAAMLQRHKADAVQMHVSDELSWYKLAK